MVMSRSRNPVLVGALLVLPLTACGGAEADQTAMRAGVIVVSFNTGTSEGMGHDALPDIDHVVSDSLQGSCWVAGLTSGHPAVSEVLYFDHKPIVCSVDLHSVDP